MESDRIVEPDPRQFYDDLAEDYHLLFSDWRASVGRQADVLDRLIATELGPPHRRILDCA